MEFIKTVRGSRKLLLNGYTYVVDKEVKETTFWRCEKRKVCNARIRTVSDIEQGNVSNHSHPPDGAHNSVLKALEKMKTRAEQTEVVTSSVIHNVVEELPLSVAGSLPKRETLARMVRRARKIDDSEDLNMTTRGENFRLYETTDVTILSTEKNLKLLSSKQTWFSDGTFQSAPLGKQLYTIHAIVSGNKTLPLVYCIASNKEEKTYDEIFKFLKSKGVQDPGSITVDFERATINSIKKNFPNTSILGCFFHFGQCLWRKIQHCGLQQWYVEVNNALFIKQLQALAFVPPSDVHELFDELVNFLNDENEELLCDFLVYFESTWLGIVQRGRRRRPIFDVDVWSVHTRVHDNLPRTNNSLEGWHQAFKNRLNVTHPTMPKLLKVIRSEQASNEMLIEQASIGIDISRPNKKYDAINDRIKTICRSYNKEEGLAFLRSLAHNF